jgi:hypothetical protein
MSKKSKNRPGARNSPRLPYFDDFMGDLPPFGGETIQVIGNPATMAAGEPVVREARLEDCDDDCEFCQQLRKQILSGNPPQVMVFE